MTSADPSDKLVALKAKVQTLTELHSRIQNLRRMHHLLKPTRKQDTDLSFLVPLPSGFSEIKGVSDVIKSEGVQEALKEARDSEKADKTDLRNNGRRENRKRRRPPSPSSPQPYISPKRRNASLFPESAEHLSPLEFAGLQVYLKTFNTEHKSARLSIWKPTRNSEVDGNTLVLKFDLLDLFIAYVTSSKGPGGVLIVESVSVLGPRERKPPYAQSSYQVYQMLTQQLATMVQSYPKVSVQSLIDLLMSYSGLFFDQCTVCSRVLSSEGHVPPVVRVWNEKADALGKWEPRHVTCKGG